MSRARETSLTFFVMYLPLLTSEVYLLVNLFSKLYGFSGLLSYLIGMTRKTSRCVSSGVIYQV